jgi:hypothetical protein
VKSRKPPHPGKGSVAAKKKATAKPTAAKSKSMLCAK